MLRRSCGAGPSPASNVHPETLGIVARSGTRAVVRSDRVPDVAPHPTTDDEHAHDQGEQGHHEKERKGQGQAIARTRRLGDLRLRLDKRIPRPRFGVEEILDVRAVKDRDLERAERVGDARRDEIRDAGAVW
jgi:hypothetical protein